MLVLVSSLALAADVPPVVHTETLQVGPHTVRFGFSDWPIRAERSLDITFAPVTGGIVGLTGKIELLAPDGKREWDYNLLPRYPRDRTRWGLDSVALNDEGRSTLRLTIGNDTADLPLEVGPRPAGPPGLLIALLSLVPIGSVLVLVVRAWLRTKPQRQREANAW
jgi:hypothetical protein